VEIEKTFYFSATFSNQRAQKIGKNGEVNQFYNSRIQIKLVMEVYQIIISNTPVFESKKEQL
jgi:hypothetical protein